MNTRQEALTWSALAAMVVTIIATLWNNVAPLPAPPIAPEPVPVVTTEPEKWIVFDASGTRISDPDIEKIAGKVAAGSFRVEGIPKPGDKRRTRQIVVSDENVPPPPKPDEPGPDPPDVPVPIPAVGLRVLILEESDGRAPAMPSLVRTPAVESYLNAKCAKVNGAPEWRVFDDDYTDEQQKLWSQIWRDAYARAKADSKGTLPWLMVSDGTKGESVPLPTDPAAFMAILKKYGGE